jgi:hypothetical protein
MRLPAFIHDWIARAAFRSLINLDDEGYDKLMRRVSFFRALKRNLSFKVCSQVRPLPAGTEGTIRFRTINGPAVEM